MSYEAGVWAAAQVMPFKTARQRARAKAVLKCLGQYAGVDWHSWVTMKVFIVETDLGHERTVQRGIADLLAIGIIEKIEGEYEVYYGRCYPKYLLRKDWGPKNTSERLALEREREGGEADVEAYDDAELGATELSPQEPRGDSPAARGDTTVVLGVTAVSPKLEENLEDNSQSAREAAARRISEVEQACPRSMLRFYDRPDALKWLVAAVGAGVTVEDLVAALGRLGRHPSFKTRNHPPQLQTWLRQQGWIGWLTDEASEQTALPLPTTTTASDGPPQDPAWTAALSRLRVELPEVKFVNVQRSALLEVDGQTFVVAPTGWARDQIRDGCWRKVQSAWTDNDPQRRPIELISKLDFEALSQRQGVKSA